MLVNFNTYYDSKARLIAKRAELKVGIFGFTIYEVTCPHAQTGISPGLGYFSLGVFFKELYLFLELKVNALLYLTKILEI